MSEHPIILSTLNARYSHTAFGLRYVWANLGPLRKHTVIREFHIKQPPLEVVESLLSENPRIIGFGVYIWNVDLITQIIQAIKGVRPDVIVVIGGPEVSYEYEGTELFALADYLIRGEGESAFPALAQTLLDGKRPEDKVITRTPVALAQLELPYDAYSEHDIAHRLLYIETSRGCPFRCEFCLSSLEPGVREFPLEPFLAAMERLIHRGARHLKFVDRTFNVGLERVERILRFFLGRWQDGMQLHFEILPDRLHPAVLDLLSQFPPGGLHLEVGVQTFNPAVQEAISRPQDLEETERNLRFLRDHTGALLHADLVAGLPGESWESLADGFNRLVTLNPHEIQVGILKRLKGAPISRHAASHKILFSHQAPYEILQTDLLGFIQLQRIKRFARYFDLYYNSGNFPESLPLLWHAHLSAFDAFMALSDSLWEATHKTHELSLAHLARHLYTFLVTNDVGDEITIGQSIKHDYHRIPGRKDNLDLPT